MAYCTPTPTKNKTVFGLDHMAVGRDVGYPEDMAKTNMTDAVAAELSELQSRLDKLDQDRKRIDAERDRILVEKAVVLRLKARAGGPAGTAISPQNDRKPTAADQSSAKLDDIHDGVEATEVIKKILRETPGLTSVQIINRVTPLVKKDTGKKGPRRFIGNVLWFMRKKKVLKLVDEGHYLSGQEPAQGVFA